ncbi:MAG TPA: arginine deiminase-related protein [Gammaproteobacteria bacterium]|nr:arginine deiminase-related protein [Gammaproteobacteria bacterium]
MSTKPQSEPGGGAGESFAASVLMVRPRSFAANPQTAPTNRFQTLAATDDSERLRAQEEFDGLVNALVEAGIEVIVEEDTPEPEKPDAVFPNNWFSTHADGSAVLYPMLVPSRRAERRPELLTGLRNRGFSLTAIVDLAGWERHGLALEGTGSLALERRARLAYVCRSPRSAEAPLVQWARLMGYRVLSFAATDGAGVAIYHTNVMLALGKGFALLGAECIADADERREVIASLEAGGREVIALSQEQIAGFGANALQLEGSRGAVIAMSNAARASLGPEATKRLEHHGAIVAAPIPTIERYGGGSVRCMLAEIFLPRTPV